MALRSSRFVSIFFVIVVTNCFSVVYAQYFSLGQDPFSTKWRQISTEHFRLIFPDSFRLESNRLANMLESSYSRVSASMVAKPYRIPLIIHNQGVISNAIVGLAPKRMEFFTTQPQDMYSQDWLDQLVLHEMRHVMQITRTKTGFGKVLPWFFGEQITAGIIGVFLPSWVIEGDAVISETALSKSGRGRVPAFEMELRAQLVEKGSFSYDKAVFGSYRDFIPDQYVLGYHLAATGRKNFGAAMWSKVFEEVGRKPFLITAFSHGIKKVSGYSKSRFYKESMKELSSIYGVQSETKKKNSREAFYSYRCPAYVNDSTVFALKTSIDDIDRFVVLCKGKEQNLFTPGQIQDKLISVNGRIYWAEIQNDIRWEQESYSVIKEFDPVRKKLQTLSKKSRYFAPSISKSGTKLCVVEVGKDYKNKLIILNSASGEVLKSIQLPENQFIQTPVFDNTGMCVLATIIGKSGKSIGLIRLDSGTVRYLIPFADYEISHPVQNAEKIYFIAGYGGISNIFSIDMNGNNLRQITDSKFGIGEFSVFPKTDQICYSDYTSDGYRIRFSSIDPEILQKPISKAYSISGLDSIIARQENTLATGRQTTEYRNNSKSDSVYAVKTYKRITNLLNFHSWAPVYIDATNQTFNPGISIMSQDLLSTSVFTAGYEYLTNEDVGRYHFSYSYQGFYPTIDFSYEGGDRAGQYYSKAENIYKRFTWKEQTLKTGITLPLDFSRNKIFQGLQFSLNSTWFETKLTDLKLTNFFEGNFQSLDYRIYAYSYLKSPQKNMYPKFGITANFQYKHTPLGGKNLGTIFNAGTQIFLPGIMKHHGGRIILSYQQRTPELYTFSDLSIVVPGYSGYTGNQFRLFYTDYKFPFWYPDLSIPSVLYLKRLTAKCFYATSESDKQGIPEKYTAAGFELSSEIHLFRFYAPIDIGFRSIYQADSKVWKTEVVYQINFDRFMGNNKFRKYQYAKM